MKNTPMKNTPMKNAHCLLLLVISIPLACSDDDGSVSVDQVRSDLPPRIRDGKGLSQAERLGLGSHARPRTLQWDLPAGWKELPAQRFRDANFALERDASVECYLTVLSGGGGGRDDNVNRWRQQMQLEALSSEEIAKLPTATMFDRDATLVELSGSFSGRGGSTQDDFGFCALFLELPGTTLTLKMTGPAAVVAEEKEHFLSIARSFRLTERAVPAVGVPPHATPSGSTPSGSNGGIVGGMATGGSGMTWTVPSGWTRGKDRAGRVVTLYPAADPKMECYVSMMDGTAGGVDLNVNRWLGQVGAAALAPNAVSKLPTFPMLGATGVLVESKGDFTGVSGESKKGAGLLGVVCVLPDRAVFVKFVGPAEQVATEKEKFLAFCRSLKNTKGDK